MSEEYLIPSGEATSTIIIKGSKFIGRAGLTVTVEEARAFIEKIRREEPGNSHAVYGYIVGYGNTVAYGQSDDGEPSGTAGRPVLEVLKGSGTGDITLVVVRYFGGIKLGTGGLVRAYTQSAQETLALLKRERKVERRSILFTLSYDLFNNLKNILADYEAEIEEQIFGTDIRLKVLLPLAKLEDFKKKVTDLSSGRVFFSML